MLSYTRWLLGDHTHGEAPNDYRQPVNGQPTDPIRALDDQMFALNFGMWW